eukprot:121580-Prymnesium_polylepis.1
MNRRARPNIGTDQLTPHTSPHGWLLKAAAACDGIVAGVRELRRGTGGLLLLFRACRLVEKAQAGTAASAPGHHPTGRGQSSCGGCG